MDKINSIKFVEVTIVPPIDEKYYQLFKGDVPTSLIISESRLNSCLLYLQEYERTNNN